MSSLCLCLCSFLLLLASCPSTSGFAGLVPGSSREGSFMTSSTFHDPSAGASSFLPSSSHRRSLSSLFSYNLSPEEDAKLKSQSDALLAKARDMIAKIESGELKPKTAPPKRSLEDYIKTSTDKGITVDAEKMMEDAAAGDYDGRSLAEMFPSSGMTPEEENKARQDAMMQIFGLKKSLGETDFKQIFNEKDPRIGEL